jgi:hypothetical protein
MSSPVSSGQQSPAEQHQEAQSGLMVLFAAAMALAWSTYVDPSNLAVTLPRYTVAVNALVRSYGAASSSAALTYYRKQRLAAGVTGPVRLRVAPPAPVEQVKATVDWGTKGLYGPSPAAKAAEPVASVTTDVVTATPDVVPDPVAAAEKIVSDAAEQIVLDQSRQTLIDAVQADSKAKGWARVTEPGACSFCLILATRGAVYKSRETGDFKAHNHCQCHVEPLFGGSYEPTAQVRAAQAIYKSSTKGQGSKANAFRRAVKAARDDGHPYL